jgi:hypothetical protein
MRMVMKHDNAHFTIDNNTEHSYGYKHSTQLYSTLIKYTKLSELLKIAINIQLKTLEIVRYETFSFQIVNFQLKYLELLNIRAT